MAKTANLYARIEPDVKEQAESILQALGIPVSNAINIFYKQIILQRGLPFDVKIPDNHPLDIAKMSKEELNDALMAGYNDALAGNVQSAEEVFNKMKERYGIDV